MFDNTAAAGLDSFYLKRDPDPIFETMTSEPNPFPNTQSMPDSIQGTPKSNKGIYEL